MKTNAIISALCVVGIAWFGAGCDSAFARSGDDLMGVPSVPVPGDYPGQTIQVQKVVYWSDIPGMKWNWSTQVINKPSIPTVGTLNTTATSAQSTSASESLSGNITLHKIAKTGAYSDLSGTPTIPTVGTLNTTLTTAQATSANESLSGTIKLHKVSKTGNLEDLSGTSLTIGNVEAKYVKIKQTGEIEVFDDFGDSVVYKLNFPNKNGHLAVLSDIPSTNGLAAKSYVDSHQWTWASITNKPSFATVATSGSYNDLSDKPTIPSASDFVQKSGDTMTGNLTIDPLDDSGPQPAIKVMWSNSMSSKYTMLRYDALVHGYLNGSAYTVNFQDKSGTMALNEDVIAIIPAWTRSSTVSYTAGDLVRYNNKLYKAKQNIAANAAWNASNWEEVTIAAEFRSKADTSWVNNHKWDWGTQITNAPSIPAAANDGTLTIQKNGKALGTFGANQSSNGTINVKGVYYATCSTAVGSVNKSATLNDSSEAFTLEEGVIVCVKFENASYTAGATSLACTLNVAGTGKKTIYIGHSSSVQNNGIQAWTAGEVVPFLYDGTYWRMLKPGVANGNQNGIVKMYPGIGDQEDTATTKATTKKVATSIAPYWVKNASTSYSTGDLVIYSDGKLYKAKNDIAANTAWNANSWQETTIKNEFASKGYVDSHEWTWESITNKPDVVTSIAIGRNNAGVSGDTELVLTHADPVVTLTTNYPTGIKIGSLSYTAGFAQLDIFEKGVPGFSPDWMNQPVTTDMYIPTNVSVFNNDAGYVTANHTHSNLVNGSTKVIANENGTMTISKGDGSSVYYSVTGTYDQYNPRAIAETDLSSYSEFSPSVTYTGYSDPILYNGAVYACQTTHTGPWDESHFRLLVPADKAGFHVRITTATSLGSLEHNQTTTAHIDVVWFLPLVGGSTQWQEHTLISYDATVQYYGTDSDGKKTFGVYNQSNVVYGEDYNGSSSGLGGVAMLTSNTYYIMDYSPGGINRIDFVGGPIGWGDARFGWSDYLVADESFTKTVATVDQISSLDNKMDKVFNPTAGHIVTVTSTGSLTDFGESPWGIRGDWNETNTNSVNYILNKPTNVSVFNNDAGYVKTNAVGSLVLGPPSANQASRAYTIVAGTGGANNESDNSIIIGPGSHIYQNSDYSGIFGPGGSIKAGSSYSFVFGASTVEAGCPNSFVIGSSATSTNACSFLWTADSLGNKTLPAAKITHGDGTFNINTLDGVAGVYIGDTNLQQIIRLEAKAMIHDAVSQVNVNLQSAEDTRVALTNLITILKNL